MSGRESGVGRLYCSAQAAAVAPSAFLLYLQTPGDHPREGEIPRGQDRETRLDFCKHACSLFVCVFVNVCVVQVSRESPEDFATYFSKRKAAEDGHSRVWQSPGEIAAQFLCDDVMPHASYKNMYLSASLLCR